jgi:catechol 2,3-dioxygenase-like lactoylglutathione lyase family enzyme
MGRVVEGEGAKVTGVANLAVKVGDLDAAIAFYEALGASVADRIEWRGSERADVTLGALRLTLFTKAIYEDEVQLPDDCFLHPALFTDDLDGALAGREILWGPAEVSGPFGRRRIAFIGAPGNMRLEFMEELDGPAN